MIATCMASALFCCCTNSSSMLVQHDNKSRAWPPQACLQTCCSVLLQYTQYQELQVARTPTLGSVSDGALRSVTAAATPRAASFSGPVPSTSPERANAGKAANAASASADTSPFLATQLPQAQSHPQSQLQSPRALSGSMPLPPLPGSQAESLAQRSSASAAGAQGLLDARSTSFTRRLAPLVRAACPTPPAGRRTVRFVCGAS
jgi:hypothetical protein